MVLHKSILVAPRIYASIVVVTEASPEKMSMESVAFYEMICRQDRIT